MSKYSHFEMCEKIFGSRYKFDKVKEFAPYSRTDMWDKMIEQKSQIKLLEKSLELACKKYNKLYCEHYCHKEPCDECENGDYMFFMYNFLDKAKEMMKSE